MSETTAILIASFNEGERLHATLRRLDTVFLRSYAGRARVVVVDDASREPVILATLPALSADLTLLRHPMNLGLGGALQTAVTYARADAAVDYFVTMDADGQHEPGSIPRLLEPLREGRSDVVFGSRFIEGCATMPSNRRALLRAATLFERRLTGLDLSDAHNGFRAFNRTTAAIFNLRQNRMAHATELKQIIARAGVRYSEVPVDVTYSAESLAKGQRNTGSLVILKDLVKSYLFHG